jgi:hypothetical protein
MGHGYYAVVAYGIVINFDSICNHLDINDKTAIAFLDALKYVHESDLRNNFNTYITNMDEFLCYIKHSKFNFHYEEQYSATSVFITLERKEILGANYRGDGCAMHIDIDKLKLTNDNELSLEKLAEFLTGEKMQVDFSMYTYEGC